MTKFKILIGLLIIFYTFYNRLIVIRLPKSLIIFNENVLNYILLVFILFNFFISCFLLIINIRQILDYKNSNGFFKSLVEKITYYLDNVLFEVYNYFLNLLPNSYEKMSKIASYFYSIFHKYTEELFVLILFTIRLSIVIAFLIDVFVFFKLHYMYKMLYLLCFSLTIRCVFYILRDFSKNLQEIESYLDMKLVGYDYKDDLPIHEYSLKEEFQHLDLPYYASHYILTSKLTGYLERYDYYSRVYTPYFNIMLYTLYLIGWSYVIIVNCY